MNINKKKVAIGLFILTVIWFGNIIYFKRHQLSEPIFMKHYYDLKVLGDESSFDIYYLVNRNDNVDIASIEIPGWGLMSVYPSEHVSYKYYKMKRATIKLDKNYLKNLLKSNRLVLTELLVQFNNGKQRKINIGKINIQLDYEHKPLLISQSSGGSSDNTGFEQFKTDKPVKNQRL